MRSSIHVPQRRSQSSSVGDLSSPAFRPAFFVGHKNAHIMLGGLAAVAGSVAGCGALVGLLNGAEHVLAAPGLLLGVVCTLPCLLGWRAATTNSKALIMSCLVWSILAAVFAFLGLITFSVDRVDPAPTANADAEQKWRAALRTLAAKAGLSACAVEVFVASIHAGVAFVSYGQLCVPRRGVHVRDANNRRSQEVDAHPSQRQALIASSEKSLSPIPFTDNQLDRRPKAIGVSTQTLPPMPLLAGTTPRLRNFTPPRNLPPPPTTSVQTPVSVESILTPPTDDYENHSSASRSSVSSDPPCPLHDTVPIPQNYPVTNNSIPRAPPPPIIPRPPQPPPPPVGSARAQHHLGPNPPPHPQLRAAPPPYEQAINLLSRRERWAKQMR